jgi:hypothetical protein
MGWDEIFSILTILRQHWRCGNAVLQGRFHKCSKDCTKLLVCFACPFWALSLLTQQERKQYVNEQDSGENVSGYFLLFVPICQFSIDLPTSWLELLDPIVPYPWVLKKPEVKWENQLSNLKLEDPCQWYFFQFSDVTSLNGDRFLEPVYIAETLG